MPLAFEIVYEYTDASGDKAESAVKLPTALTLTNYTDFGRAMGLLLNNIVSGIVSRAGLRIAIDVSALTGNVVDTTSDVEDVGAFQYTTAEGRPVRLNVPGIIEAKVLAGSDDIDTADADIAALNTAVISGVAVTAGTIPPSDVAEDDITTLVFARERFRSTS